MRIEIRTKGVELEEGLKPQIERRLRFALTRFSSRLDCVRVLLRAGSDPCGGVDILCKIRFQSSAQDAIVICDVNDDPLAAVARVADRASRSLARQFDRLHEGRRSAVFSLGRPRPYETSDSLIPWVPLRSGLN